MNRTFNVMRMQLVNRQTYVWMPLIILGGSFVLSLMIYALIPTDAPKYGGAAQAPLWTSLGIDFHRDPELGDVRDFAIETNVPALGDILYR